MAMILVTHDLGVIAGNTDRVAVMYGGQVVETRLTATLFARPRHRYTEALFEALPERAVETGERALLDPGPAAGPRRRRRPAAGSRRAAGSPPTSAARGSPSRRDAATASSASRASTPGEHHVDRAAVAASPHAEVETRSRQLDVATIATSRSPPTASPSRGARGRSSPTTAAGSRLRSDPDGVPLIEFRERVKDFPVRSEGCSGGARRRSARWRDVDLGVRRGTTRRPGGGVRLRQDHPRPARGRAWTRRPRARCCSAAGRLARLTGKEARERRAGVQLMFQDSYASLDPRMRVRQILREPLEIQHVGTSRTGTAGSTELLEAVGLPARRRSATPTSSRAASASGSASPGAGAAAGTDRGGRAGVRARRVRSRRRS